jgi:hypothetical protein
MFIMANRARSLLLLGSLAAALPAPSPTSFGTVKQVPAIETKPPRGSEPGAAPTLVNSGTTGITTHGPYSGTATTIGAEQGPATLSATIPSNSNLWATYHNPNGKLSQPQPVPSCQQVRLHKSAPATSN